MRKLTKEQESALDRFGLVYAKSDEPGAGWFAYDDEPDRNNGYPGSSCECIETVVEWFRDATKKV